MTQDYNDSPESFPFVSGPVGRELHRLHKKTDKLRRELEDARRETRRTLYVALVIAGGHGVDIANIIPGY